ncbi:MAG: hypothetical protein JWO63_125, partial [Frankiales bacterium]|nr:hypothetical protein [Frankiales bacterium]
MRGWPATGVRQSSATSATSAWKSAARVCIICSAWRASPIRVPECRLCLTLYCW